VKSAQFEIGGLKDNNLLSGFSVLEDVLADVADVGLDSGIVGGGWYMSG